MTIQNAHTLIEYIVENGKRIKKEAGRINDIGVVKQYLTQEDLNIERGINQIVQGLTPNMAFFAEEEHDTFVDDEDVWVVDPISGTHLFIKGEPHYAIVASHLNRGITDFAVVYDPSVDELFTADLETGAFQNGKSLTKKEGESKPIIYAPTGYASAYPLEVVGQLKVALEQKYEIVPSVGSFALNYCHVAAGRFAGVVSLTKDSYPEFAGTFIANMAGYTATNVHGSKTLNPPDRAFVCGGENYNNLLTITQEVILK